MKVAVLGAGAVGSMLGGLIKHHDPSIDVTLIARGEHGRAMSERGSVRLDGPWGSWQVHLTASLDVGDISGSDFVLFTVKSRDSQEAISGASRYLGNAIVISIQNGINDAVLGEFVSPKRLVMGMTATNVAVLEPGTVSLQLDGPTVVGPSPSGENADAARRAEELLRKTGLQIAEHPNMLGARYSKLAISVLGAVACLSNSNFITEAICHRPWRSSVGLPLLNECIRIFAAANIKLPEIATAFKLRRLLHLLDAPLIGSALAHTAELIYNKKPIVFSLSQDLRRGKPTEVDHINGEVVRLAHKHQTDAPLNALAVKMCRELEQRGPAAFYSRDQVIERCQRVGPRDWAAA